MNSPSNLFDLLTANKVVLRYPNKTMIYSEKKDRQMSMDSYTLQLLEPVKGSYQSKWLRIFVGINDDRSSILENTQGFVW